jgi:hypothetical protein
MKNSITIKTSGTNYNYKSIREFLNQNSPISAAMINQLLESPVVVEELKKIKGEYTWTLEGYQGQYQIVADGTWKETNVHSTPRAAANQFFATF